MIVEHGDLGDQTLDRCLVKFCDSDRLAFDEVLQAADELYLFIHDHAVHLGLFAHVPKSENLISDFVVIALYLYRRV